MAEWPGSRDSVGWCGQQAGNGPGGGRAGECGQQAACGRERGCRRQEDREPGVSRPSHEDDAAQDAQGGAVRREWPGEGGFGRGASDLSGRRGPRGTLGPE